MFAGPEVTRSVGKFESSLRHSYKVHVVMTHHGQDRGYHVNFDSHIQSTADMIEVMGDQFTDNDNRLYRINTKRCFGDEGMDKLANTGSNQMIGQKLFENYQNVLPLKNYCVRFSRLHIACQTRKIWKSELTTIKFPECISSQHNKRLPSLAV